VFMPMSAMRTLLGLVRGRLSCRGAASRVAL